MNARRRGSPFENSALVDVVSVLPSSDFEDIRDIRLECFAQGKIKLHIFCALGVIGMRNLFHKWSRRAKKRARKYWHPHEQSSSASSSPSTHSSRAAITSSRDSLHPSLQELEEDKNDGQLHKESSSADGASEPAVCVGDDAGDPRPLTDDTNGSPVNCEPQTDSLPPEPQFRSGLWQQAFTQLSEKRQAGLMDLVERGKTSSGFSALSSVVTSDLVAALRQRQAEWEQNSWTFTLPSKDGEETVIGIRDKVAECIDFLTAAGDLGVAFAPSLVQQVWPCVKAVLQIPAQDAKQVQIMLQVADKVANVATKGALYESLYSSTNTPLDYFDKIQDILIKMYKATLEMLSSTAESLDKGTVHRMMSSVVQTYGQEENQLVDLEAQLESAVKDVDRTRISKALEVVEIAREQKVLEWISRVPFTQNHKDERKKRMHGTCKWLLEHAGFREWDATSGPSLMWLQGESRSTNADGSPGVLADDLLGGTGKTCLTSKVIDHTREVMDRWKVDAGLAFFYFKRDESTRNSALQCLRSLVRQLSTSFHQSGQIRSDLQRIYDEWRRRGEELDEEVCEEQLRKSLRDFSRVTIIIDALDECARDERRNLIAILDRLMEDSGARLAIFISSRPYLDIKSTLHKRSVVEVGSHNNQGDIDKFVNEKIWRHEHPAWTIETKNTVIRKLLEKSQGMFRLAQLHVDELLKLDIPEDIKERLETLPKGLKEAYDNIYLHPRGGRSERESKIIVRAVLWMLALGVPPVSKFLVEAVRIDPVIYMRTALGSPQRSHDSHDDDYVLSYCDEAMLLRLCANLLTLNSSNEWQFCHASVSEYFQENHFGTLQAHAHASCVSLLVLIDVARSQHAGYMVGAAKASEIHQDALLNLDLSRLEKRWALARQAMGPMPDQITCWRDKAPEFFEDGKLFGYAVQSWMHHITWMERVPEDQDDHTDLGYHGDSPALVDRTGVIFLLQEFLGCPNDSSPAYRLWLSWFADDSRDDTDAPDWQSHKTKSYASFAIVRYGFFKLLPEYWQDAQCDSPPDQDGKCKKIDTTIRSCRGWGLLEIASYFGHIPIVKSLSAARIDNMDVSKPSNSRVSSALPLEALPLSVAAHQGQLEVCKTLIQHAGSNPNFPAGSLNPLYVALKYNHLDCVHFLLSSGADLDIPAKELLQQGSLEHNGLLPLTVGSEQEKSVLLQEASAIGDLAAVEQLLRENVDVNMALNSDEIVSHLENVLEHYFPIVERLIYVLEEIDTTTMQGGQETPRNDCSGMIELLIRMKATVQDGIVKYGGRTALQAASAGGHLEVVERLLQAGADVNARPAAWGQTALHAAAANGFLAIVDCLIRAGANVNDTAGYKYQDKNYPYLAATENGHDVVAKRLTQQGVRMVGGPPPAWVPYYEYWFIDMPTSSR